MNHIYTSTRLLPNCMIIRLCQIVLHKSAFLLWNFTSQVSQTWKEVKGYTLLDISRSICHLACMHKGVLEAWQVCVCHLLRCSSLLRCPNLGQSAHNRTFFQGRLGGFSDVFVTFCSYYGRAYSLFPFPKSTVPNKPCVTWNLSMEDIFGSCSPLTRFCRGGFFRIYFCSLNQNFILNSICPAWCFHSTRCKGEQGCTRHEAPETRTMLGKKELGFQIGFQAWSVSIKFFEKYFEVVCGFWAVWNCLWSF